MSDFKVTSSADDGSAGTLRYELAREAAAGTTGNTITFDDALKGSTIALDASQGALSITDGVTLDGTGSNITISGQNAVTDFIVDNAASGQTATIKGLTIADGSSVNAAPNAAGGVLLLGGSLVLADDTLSNNNAVGLHPSSPKGTGGAAGGAVFAAGGTLVLKNDVFSSNTASGGSSLGGIPGSAASALYVASGASVVSSHSQFVSNAATGTVDFFADNFGSSATVFIEKGSSYSELNSLYTGNTATEGTAQNPVPSNGPYQEPDPACYVTGTLIRTARGEVAIEALAAGDSVVTAAGAHRPVRWIGRRSLDLTQHAEPTTVWPIRVAAGAFGESVPARDLWMSPGHCVFVEGVLMPIRSLVNEASVAQVPVSEITYWHVELDSHDVILADGLPAESYLDTGNRAAFENGAETLTLHPDFEPAGAEAPAHKCAPVRSVGPEVQAARRTLAARLSPDDYPTTTLHDLHILADGRRIDPVMLGDKRMAFVLPEASATVTLASRSFVPWQGDPRLTDARVLGVSIKRLQVDGQDVDLARDMPGTGWHRLEVKPRHVQRWTNGAATLPSGARLVLVDLAGDGRYWVARRDNVIALRA